MNRNQRLFTAFLGGMAGILLSGYAYYFTNEQHYWLLPIGVFFGSAIGYSMANAKTFFQNVVSYTHSKKNSAALLMGRWKKKVIVFYHYFKRKLKIFGPTFTKAMRLLGESFIKMAKSIMTMHPVTKALVMRTLTSIVFFTGAGYLWVTKVIQKDTIREIFSKGTTNDEFAFLTLLIIFSLLSLGVFGLMTILMNIFITFDDQASFFREYEKYNNKLTMIVKNLASDLVMFVFSQLLAFAMYAIFLLTMGYIVVFGAITMLCMLIGLSGIEYARSMKKNGSFVTLATTFVITSICYFIFRSLFDNQIVIWIVALCSGSFCGLACHNLEIYLKRLDSVEKIDNLGVEFSEKILNITFGYIPKKILKIASPHIQRFMSLIASKEEFLARI